MIFPIKKHTSHNSSSDNLMFNLFFHFFSFSGMLLIDKNKPSIMKWRGKNEHYTCNYTLAGVQGTTMRNKAKRRREKEINRKVTELLNSGRCEVATSLASRAIRNLIWWLVPFTAKILLVTLLLSAKQFLSCRFGEFGIELTNNPLIYILSLYSSLVCLIL